MNNPCLPLLTSASLLLIVVPTLRAQETGADEAGDAPDFAPQVVKQSKDSVHIPFHLNGGRPVPVVEVMVNGEGPFEFFFDSGASTCLLHTGFAVQQGIDYIGEAAIGDHTANARVAAHYVELDSLEFEGLRLEGIRAQVVDKDRSPQWALARLEDVTVERVAAMLAPLGENELRL